jgi:adenine-specific DNA-methyltransferase
MKFFQIQNRRYTGSKFKLLNWIYEEINKNENFNSFFDPFSGTGCVVQKFLSYKKIIINDFLDSNFIIYKAFFNSKKYDLKKLMGLANQFNSLKINNLKDNYFSINFSKKYFSYNDSKLIGYIREVINELNNITPDEKNILLASLLYSVDRSANTVGHYDAYIIKDNIDDKFMFRLIEPYKTKSDIKIYNMDANELIKSETADVIYVDPPYNSRQYARFYHILENLVKWEKPQLFGKALKPEPTHVSEYCKINAVNKFKELVLNARCKLLAVSYNNTYDSKSGSSKNKIPLEQILEILKIKGKTKINEKDYNFFNAGKTNFKNHKEYLFLTKVN